MPDLRFRAQARTVGNDVDTDQITPGKYLALITPEELGGHVLEGYDPDFPASVRPGSVLVAGENFGCGSSREHAPLAILGAGFHAVLAESFARIFYRNAFNVALPAVEVPGISAAVRDGDVLDVDLERGTIQLPNGRSLQAEALTEQAQALLDAGGLVPMVRARLGVVHE